MKPLAYRLVVTTDGRPNLLERTLDSFFAHVKPQPSEIVIVDDSGDADRRRYLDALGRDYADSLRSRATVVWHPKRLGFCQTVSDAWTLAAADDPLFSTLGVSHPETERAIDWVFWTEDDFEHERMVDLRDVAYVLEREPKIAQMSLMRHPVNERERAAGGLYELYRDKYERMGGGGVTWLRSSTNFSTTMSLMRRRFMADHAWPSYAAECEGKFSIDLLAAGYKFGVWGIGSPWVRHIGDVRAGTGY